MAPYRRRPLVHPGGGVRLHPVPDVAFLSLAAIIGWYLIFKGFLDIVVAFAARPNELWWLGLVVGIGELLIGFWAAGYPGRSISLLIVWVAASALARGIGEIFLAFRLRGVQRPPA